MKVTYLRATAALALGLALGGCGGKASFDVAGVVEGLSNPGLVLSNGSDTVTVPAGATSFTFPQRITYGTDYDIEVKTPPAHMSCTVYNGSGSAGHTTTIQATVQCTQLTHNLGGLITGLVGTDPVGTGLILANGSTGGQYAATKPADGSGNVDFTFPVPVQEGQSYGVTVYVQPNGLFCTVTNGTDVMQGTDVGNVLVACKPQ